MVVAKIEVDPETAFVAEVETAEKFAAVTGRSLPVADQIRAERKQAAGRLAEDTSAADTQAAGRQAAGRQAADTLAADTLAAESDYDRDWMRTIGHRNSRRKNDRGIPLQQNRLKPQKIRSRQRRSTVCESDESWQGLLKIVSNQIVWEFP